MLKRDCIDEGLENTKHCALYFTARAITLVFLIVLCICYFNACTRCVLLQYLQMCITYEKLCTSIHHERQIRISGNTDYAD